MKTKKITYLSVLVAFAIGAMAYGFIQVRKPATLENKTKTKTAPPTTVSAAQAAIIGTWVREDDPTIKMVFGLGGILKMYTNNVEDFSGNYIITTTCDGETYDSGTGVGLYLKTKDATESSWICQYIFALNDDSDHILSLGDKDRYTTGVYVKQ